MSRKEGIQEWLETVTGATAAERTSEVMAVERMAVERIAEGGPERWLLRGEGNGEVAAEGGDWGSGC